VDILLSGEAQEIGVSPAVSRNTYKPAVNAVQNVIRLRENTLLSIDKLTAEQTGGDTVSDTQLDLRAGRVFFNVKKTSAASRYEIKLPNGVAGIRGSIGEFAEDTGDFTMFSGSAVLTFLIAPPLRPTLPPDEYLTRTIVAGQKYNMNDDTYAPIPQGQSEEHRAEGEEMSHTTGGNGGDQGDGHEFVDDKVKEHQSETIGEGNTQSEEPPTSSAKPGRIAANK
jgi:hypothetical protein